MKYLKQYSVLILLVCISSQLFAGATCQQSKLTINQMRQAIHAASKLKTALDKSHSDVALIARSGTDLSKYNLRFSHLAFAIKSYHGQPGWTVVHLLNECGTQRSNLYAQGLVNFFMDDMYRYDSQVTVLKPSLQRKLRQAINSKAKHQLHGARYNMLAYPFATKYQNSNQWILEMLARADSNKPVQTRYQAQMWLWRMHYQPTVISINALEKFGSAFNSNIAFNDHPIEESRLSRYSVVSVESIIQYLKRRHQTLKTFIV